MRGSKKLVESVAATLLVVLVVLSAGSIVITGMNYSEGTDAARKVKLELHDLQLRTGSKPEIEIVLRVSNGSSLDIKLEDLHFGVYLNGDFMGSNYDAFAGKVVAGSKKADLNFVIPLRPFYVQHIEQAQQQEEFEWFLRGQAHLYLPFNAHRLSLAIREGWTGAGE